MLMGISCNTSQHLENQEPPKLENFLGIGEVQNRNNNINGDYSIYSSVTNTTNNIGSNTNNNNTIGLSMIKNWLRNNPNTTTPSENDNKEGEGVVVGGGNNAQSLSLSMSTGGGGGGGGENSCSSENNKQQENANGTNGSIDAQNNGAIEAVPRKSIDTFGQRTSIYRGVTRYCLFPFF